MQEFIQCYNTVDPDTRRDVAASCMTFKTTKITRNPPLVSFEQPAVTSDSYVELNRHINKHPHLVQTGAHTGLCFWVNTVADLHSAQHLDTFDGIQVGTVTF